MPHANLTLRRVPEALSNDVALFAGDVMGTGYHAIAQAGLKPGDTCAVIGLGPVGLCAVMAARVAGRGARDRDRHGARAAGDGALAGSRAGTRHRRGSARGGEGRHRGPRRGRGGGRRGQRRRCSTWPAAWRARPGPCRWWACFSERIELHMGVVWIKNLRLVTGQANVIGHLDAVLSLMAAGRAGPHAAGHPPHEARGRAGGVRRLRQPPGAEDRPERLSFRRALG